MAAVIVKNDIAAVIPMNDMLPVADHHCGLAGLPSQQRAQTLDQMAS
jgi:hypothetical protein